MKPDIGRMRSDRSGISTIVIAIIVVIALIAVAAIAIVALSGGGDEGGKGNGSDAPGGNDGSGGNDDGDGVIGTADGKTHGVFYVAHSGSAVSTASKTASGDYTVGDVDDADWDGGKWFKVWNTKADGTGTEYKDGDVIGLSSDLVLYGMSSNGAPPSKTLTAVIYVGFIDDKAYIEQCTSTSDDNPMSGNHVVMMKWFDLNYIISWNTAPDGSGRTYESGDPVHLDSDLVLYAMTISP